LSRSTNSEAEESTVDAVDAFVWALKRDLKVALHSIADLSVVIVFYVLVTSLFPLAISPDPSLLQTVAPGVAWIATLLAGLLALPYLFAHEHADGSLEQLVLADAPLPALVAGKVFAHWLVTGLPIILLVPITGLQFGLTLYEVGLLMLSLLLGTSMLSWFGAMGAALTLGTRGGPSLLALLVLPLSVPVLVFGAGAVQASRDGIDITAHLSLLGAGMLIAWVFGPFVTALAVRIAHE